MIEQYEAELGSDEFLDLDGKIVRALQIKSVEGLTLIFFDRRTITKSAMWLSLYPVKSLDFYVFPVYGVNSWGVSYQEFLQQYRPKI